MGGFPAYKNFEFPPPLYLPDSMHHTQKSSLIPTFHQALRSAVGMPLGEFLPSLILSLAAPSTVSFQSPYERVSTKNLLPSLVVQSHIVFPWLLVLAHSGRLVETSDDGTNVTTGKTVKSPKCNCLRQTLSEHVWILTFHKFRDTAVKSPSRLFLSYVFTR
jgi:hypothetical protein